MKIELGDIVEHSKHGEVFVDDIKEIVVGVEDGEPIKRIGVEILDADGWHPFSEPEPDHLWWDEFVDGVESVVDE